MNGWDIRTCINPRTGKVVKSDKSNRPGAKPRD